MTLTFRDAMHTMLPKWLRNGNIGKVMYTIGLHLDGLGDAAVAGVRRRFPEPSSEDAAAILGHDRKIIRGRDEPWETYAVRLRRWREDHRKRGGPYALLQQLHAFWAQAPFGISLLYPGANKTYFSMSTSGVITRAIGTMWTPADFSTRWSRWLLVYQWPDPLPDPINWGDPGETWGSGRVWGSGLSSQEVSDIRRVPRQWGNAHSRGRIRLMNGLDILEISVE